MRRLFIPLMLASLALTACQKNVTGTFKGTGSTLFGLVPYEAVLTVDKDGGSLVMGDMPIGKLRVKHETNRFILYDNDPSDGVVFNIESNGNTLTCNHCEGLRLPKHWERQN